MSAHTGGRGTGTAGRGSLNVNLPPPLSARLMEHEDDPDVDEPLAAPLGHILGREPTPSEQGGPEGPD